MKRAERGRFVTFEGGEGAGKSTQIARLAARLRAAGIAVLLTREPGGTPAAEALRAVALSGGAQPYGPTAEAILMAAARADHVAEAIRPALAAGTWVLCDRFFDSTRVYQGEAGVSMVLLDALEDIAAGSVRPDVTVLLDLPPQIGLARAARRGSVEAPDRFEADHLAVHIRRQELFRALADAEPWRFLRIDGADEPDVVAMAIWKGVCEHFPELTAQTDTAEVR